MKRLCLLAILFLFFLNIWGCENIPGITKTPKTLSLSTPKGPVLARAGNWTITVDEFNKQVNNIIELNEGKTEIPIQRLGILAQTLFPYYVESIDLGTVEGKRIYLDFLMQLEMLAQEAELRGIQRRPEVAKSIRRSKVEILDVVLLEDIFETVTVTPIEVEDFYNNEYKKQLEDIEQRKVREIVVASQTKAKDMLVQLLTGANFSTLASEHSISESASKGGDLGYLVYREDYKFPKFWQMVGTLDEGENSSIFKHPGKDEYYIILVEDIKKGEVESLSEVYNYLEYVLIRRKNSEAVSNLITKIKDKKESQIRVNSNLLN